MRNVICHVIGDGGLAASEGTSCAVQNSRRRTVVHKIPDRPEEENFEIFGIPLKAMQFPQAQNGGSLPPLPPVWTLLIMDMFSSTINDIFCFLYCIQKHEYSITECKL